MKIQNYGEWKGDKRGGHHPPACTCYRCNEVRLNEEAAQGEARRVAEYDRRVAESSERPQADTNRDKVAAPTRPGGGQSRASTTSERLSSEAVRLLRAVTASALRYALGLHAVAAVGLLAYALIQGGASSVLPTLDSATDAYINAWRTMGAMAGLG